MSDPMNEAIEFFAAKVKKLEEENAKLEGEIESISQENTLVNSSLWEATCKIRELESVISELQDQNLELRKEFKRLVGQRDDAVIEYEAASKKIGKLESEISQSLSPCVLESYKQQVEALYKKWQRESDSRKMWESEAKHWKITYKNAHDDCKSLYEELVKLRESPTAGSQAENQRLKDLLTQAELRASHFTKQYARCTKESEELKERIKTFDEIHVKSLEDIKRKEARSEFYEAEAQYRHEKVEQLQKELEFAKGESEHFQERCRFHSTRANGLEHDVNKLQEQLKKTQDRANNYESYHWLNVSKLREAQERLKNADQNRKWCDAATTFLGPFAEQLQAWYDKGNELFGTVNEIADGWNKPGADYPWAKDLNTTGEEKSSSP